MKKALKVGCALALLASTSLSYAGVFGRTVHSRANCLNNESITWWRGHYNTWRVVSAHLSPYGQAHVIDTGWQYTWRAHAIHWGEGNPVKLWQVWGDHYEYGISKVRPFARTYAIECSIIDGWI